MLIRVITILLAISSAFGWPIFASKYIDTHILHLHGAFFHFSTAAAVSFVVTWGAVFIASLAGFSPNSSQSRPQMPVRGWLAAASIICCIVGTISAGPAGLFGAVAGTILTLWFYSGAL
jgi:hypothetical protein